MAVGSPCRMISWAGWWPHAHAFAGFQACGTKDSELLLGWGFSCRVISIVLRLVPVAAMKFHLYLGKEIVVFLVNQFLESRSHVDSILGVLAHQLSSAHMRRVEVVSGLIKEATLSLGARYALWNEQGPLHPLGEVGIKI